MLLILLSLCGPSLVPKILDLCFPNLYKPVFNVSIDPQDKFKKTLKINQVLFLLSPKWVVCPFWKPHLKICISGAKNHVSMNFHTKFRYQFRVWGWKAFKWKRITVLLLLYWMWCCVQCEGAVQQGYHCERHDVVTEDGFILGVYRLTRPGLRNCSLSPVLLYHGAYGCYTGWLMAGPSNGLGTMLNSNPLY